MALPTGETESSKWHASCGPDRTCRRCRWRAAPRAACVHDADFVVVYSSMALFQIEPELDSTGGLDVAMFAQGADEFITGSSATVFA
jgi:hypothetical protein